jgi:hypothetical protein
MAELDPTPPESVPGAPAKAVPSSLGIVTKESGRPIETRNGSGDSQIEK